MNEETLRYYADYYYKMYLYYCEKLAEMREPKESITKAEVERIKSLIGKNVKE